MQIMHFKSRNCNSDTLDIWYKNQLLNVEKVVKFLDFTLDKISNWQTHIQNHSKKLSQHVLVSVF